MFLEAFLYYKIKIFLKIEFCGAECRFLVACFCAWASLGSREWGRDFSALVERWASSSRSTFLFRISFSVCIVLFYAELLSSSFKSFFHRIFLYGTGLGFFFTYLLFVFLLFVIFLFCTPFLNCFLHIRLVVEASFGHDLLLVSSKSHLNHSFLQIAIKVFRGLLDSFRKDFMCCMSSVMERSWLWTNRLSPPGIRVWIGNYSAVLALSTFSTEDCVFDSSKRLDL